MHDLLIHELGTRRVHWRYDDPSALSELAGHGDRDASGRPVRAAAELRVRSRRFANPRMA